MKVSRSEIEKALIRLAAHFPEARHNGETIATLAEDWEEDLGVYSISAATFHAALKVTRRECKFFPKISELLAACKTIDSFRASRATPGQLRLAERQELTDDELRRNKLRISALIKGIDTGMTEEDLECAVFAIQSP